MVAVVVVACHQVFWVVTGWSTSHACAQILEKTIMQTKGALKLAKVNSDTQEQLAQAFNIKSYVGRHHVCRPDVGNGRDVGVT